MSDRLITTSTCCSGIGAPETSDMAIERAAIAYLTGIKSHLTQKDATAGITFRSLWAMDFVMACQEELLALPSPPMCCFQDLLHHLPDHLRPMCGLDGGLERHATYLKKILPQADIRMDLWCCAHGRVCRVRSADLHTAGTPCTDHSSQGKMVMRHA